MKGNSTEAGPGRTALIRADGSHETGLGHVYRMRALAVELNNRGWQVEFLSRQDRVAVGLVESAGIRVHTFAEKGFWKCLEKAVENFDPEVVICDVLETSPDMMAGIRRRVNACVVNMDDVGAGLQLADVVINAMVFQWGRYDSTKCRARLLEGPDYMILQPDLLRYAGRHRPVSKNAVDVLMAFGGTDTHFVTERVLDAVNKMDTRLNLKVSLGPGTARTSGFEQAVQASPHFVSVVQSCPDLFREMVAADIVLCAGGVMLYELAALGVPSVSVATEPHEVFNMDYWAGIGTTIPAGCEKNLDGHRVTAAVLDLAKDPDRRFEMSRKGRRAVDALGLQRCVCAIEEMMV